MNNTIQYKGYVGSVEFSEEDGIFFGKVMGIRSLISYEGESAKEVKSIFVCKLPSGISRIRRPASSPVPLQ